MLCIDSSDDGTPFGQDFKAAPPALSQECPQVTLSLTEESLADETTTANNEASSGLLQQRYVEY